MEGLESADTGVMTRVLDTITGVLSGGAEALGGEAVGLLSVLIAIEITWAGLMWALGSGQQFFRQYLRKIIKVGIFGFLVVNWASVVNVIRDGFVWVGIELGGGDVQMSTMQDPSAIIEQGFVATGDVFANAAQSGVLSSGMVSDFMMALVGLVVVCLYFLVALQVFITLVEFYLIAAFGVVMIPWGVNKHTAFIAERYFGAILAQGTKLMVVIALVGILLPVVNEMQFSSAYPTFAEMLAMAFGMATIAWLMWRAPAVAGDLMAGSASLSANDAMGAAAGGAAMGVAAGKTAAGAAATVASGGAAAPVAAGAAMGAARSIKDSVQSGASSLGGSGGGESEGGK